MLKQSTIDFAADLRRKIAQMEARADRSESDGEYEACRQVLIEMNARLERLVRR